VSQHGGRDACREQVVVGEVTDRVDAIVEIAPEGVDVTGTGEPPGQPDDRDAIRRIGWAFADHDSAWASSSSAYSPAGSPKAGCSSRLCSINQRRNRSLARSTSCAGSRNI